MKKSLLSKLKGLLITISPYLKYFLFLLLMVYPLRNLYFYSLHIYIDGLLFLICYFSASIVISVIANKNKELPKISWGMAAYDFLIVELYCFILFAQFYTTAAILIVAAVVASSIWLHIKIEMLFEKGNRRRHKRASAVVCLVACVVMLIPSCIGLHKEYFSHSMTDADWERFVSSFKTDYGGRTDEDLFEKYAAVVAELDSWNKLDLDERTELLRKIALIEKEKLGIDSAEFTVLNDKLGEFTCGYYSNIDKEIVLSVLHISEDNMEDNLRTLCHEVFHAYEHYIVDRLDFDSEIVKNNYYFENARKWRDNLDNYVPGAVDFDMYSSQPLEADARQYASDRVEAYLKKLNNE